MSMPTVDKSMPLRERLRAALPVAIKARDRDAVKALRSALGAIDNAEAIDTGDAVRAGAIEASAAGLGAQEARRRDLTESDIEAIVAAEIADRNLAAADYEGRGRSEYAAALRAEAEVLAGLL
ncbi:hypothetical protein [Nocardia sp. NPDC052566]|uniref:hypothetical protein n=1 Tax=Nocardia sp. NPDC052566 TaxID=3364330 RepID=UPI0037C58F03